MKWIVPILLFCALFIVLSNQRQAAAFYSSSQPAENSRVVSSSIHTHAEAEIVAAYTAGNFFSTGIQKHIANALLYAIAAFAGVVMVMLHLFAVREQAFLNYLSYIFPFHSFW